MTVAGSDPGFEDESDVAFSSWLALVEYEVLPLPSSPDCCVDPCAHPACRVTAPTIKMQKSVKTSFLIGTQRQLGVHSGMIVALEYPVTKH